MNNKYDDSLIKLIYNNLISYFLILIYFCLIKSLPAQSTSRDIKDYVTDAKSGEALPYANITSKGKKVGTIHRLAGSE